MRTNTLTLRALASASIRSSWWFAPSTSATQRRAWVGSRRCASSNTWATTVAAASTTPGGEPFAGGGRPGAGMFTFGVGGRQDVGHGAHYGGAVVDRAHLGDALPVALLTLGQPPGELRGGLIGGSGGGWAQRVGAHHDALPVDLHHQHVGVLGGRRGLVAGVEVVEVGRGPPGETLHLTLAELLPAAPVDRGHRLLERSAAGLDGGHLAQPVGVALHRQVQLPVHRIQVRLSSSAVREPVYLHDTENRLKCPPVPRLHPGAGSPPDLHDVNPSFPLGA